MTELKIVQYKRVVADPDQNLIKMLEDLLARAKEGELIGMAAAFIDAHYDGVTAKGGTHTMATAGALQMMATNISIALLQALQEENQS